MSDKTAVAKKDTFRDSVMLSKPTFDQVFGEQAKQRFTKEMFFAISAAKNNPMLAACSGESVKMALVSVALMGITLDPAQALAYLVPRGKVCTLDVSYRGKLQALVNAKTISHAEQIGIVYEGESFEYALGTENAYIKHSPFLKVPEGAEKLAAYVILAMPDGGKFFHLMRWPEIMKRREEAKTKNVWDKWEEDMAIKTVIRHAAKYLPSSEASGAMQSAHDSAHSVQLEREPQKLLE